ncbi:MAG: pyridine nucleotide-disulfide oxidoreductase, partial [Candidatus Zixiibacteriota bacterium]
MGLSQTTPKLSMAEKNDRLKVIIIGGVAAGPKTGTTLARRMPQADIILFQKEDDISYGTCGLPYYASGDVNSFDELIQTSYDVKRDVDFFKKSKDFNVVTGAEVIKIDRDKKEVTVKLLKSGELSNHKYDKLVLAVGATPTSPPFPVTDCDIIRPFTRPEDAICFRKMAEQGQLDKVAIVGGGFIGCEMAEAVVAMWGIDAILIEKENQLLPYVLDPEMAHLVELEIKKQGVKLLTGQSVKSVELDIEEKPEIVTADGESYTTDFVFLCLGVQPLTNLA